MGILNHVTNVGSGKWATNVRILMCPANAMIGFWSALHHVTRPPRPEAAKEPMHEIFEVIVTVKLSTAHPDVQSQLQQYRCSLASFYSQKFMMRDSAGGCCLCRRAMHSFKAYSFTGRGTTFRLARTAALDEQSTACTGLNKWNFPL